MLNLSNTKDRKILGDRLRELRAIKQISQEELSLAIHCDRTSIVNWESGKKIPDTINLYYICDYFDIELYNLLDSSESWRKLPTDMLDMLENLIVDYIMFSNRLRKSKDIIDRLQKTLALQRKISD